MLKLFALGILLAIGLAAPDLFALDAPKIADLKGEASESLFVFLKRLPAAFELQVFYALFGAGLAGALASWLWKWTQGASIGIGHFTPRYILGQTLWLAGSSIAAIATVGFTTTSGEFFGWLGVLWTGALAGFSGEVKVDRKEWTPAQRAAKAVTAIKDTLSQEQPLPEKEQHP